MKNKKLIIFGLSSFAEIAHEYFSEDSDYEVVAFTASKSFIKENKFLGKPVEPFESIEKKFPPSKFEIFIALTYGDLNSHRTRFYNESKNKGYTLANYISSHAFVSSSVKIKDNVFIFENNTIQPFVEIGSNNIFWSGNHIGHHSKVGDNNFISSHVVISGHCVIGNNNFIGVNATIINNLEIENYCLLGSFVHIVKNIKEGSLIKGTPNAVNNVSTFNLFKITK